MHLLFEVQGEAIPQGSKTIAQGGGRVWLREANPKLKAWRENLARQVREQMDAYELPTFPKHEPIRAVILVYLPKPKSVTRSKPTVKPDVDKLCRAIFDGLTMANVWSDDSQCVEVKIAKHYCLEGDTPKVFINLHTSDSKTANLNP
jgi:Holliday junction resolvase RusA-like endonuclease